MIMTTKHQTELTLFTQKHSTFSALPFVTNFLFCFDSGQAFERRREEEFSQNPVSYHTFFALASSNYYGLSRTHSVFTL